MIRTSVKHILVQRIPFKLWTRAALCVAAVAAASTIQPASARDPIQPEAQWTLSEDFGKSKKARINLSGAACAPTEPAFASCVIVNDDKKYAQTFSIEGTTLRPARVFRLLDENAKGDPDAEAAAYDDGYFYLTGSHGRPRNNPDKHNPASYTLFRYPVDNRTLQPSFGGDEQVDGLEATTRLREVLRTLAPTADKYDQQLSDGGINIEGIAIRDGRIYFGLRGPSIGDHAFMISVDRDAIFTPDRPLQARSHALELGAHAGIRDLARVQDGLLVLSGPVNDQNVAPAVHLWRNDGDLERLGTLDVAAAGVGAKAETLLVLQDTAGAPWRVLVMFDGPENGMPMEYVLRR